LNMKDFPMFALSYERHTNILTGTAQTMASEESANIGGAIFEHEGFSFSEEMADKVRQLHEHFDADGDGYLSFEEIRSLQLLTSGADMPPDQYVMVCRALGCHPTKGISLEALRLTYASEGTDIDEDYRKVFPKGKKAKDESKSSVKNEDEDDVIEVGEGGVDISP